MDQTALHNMGAGLSTQGKLDAIGQATAVPIAALGCPSRRPTIQYPYVHPSPYFNMTKPSLIGRSDYAVNSGDNFPGIPQTGPSTLAAGDAVMVQVLNTHSGGGIFGPDGALVGTGVCFLLSTAKAASITDGASNTLLAGEKNLSPDCYTPGACPDDDQGWNIGYDWDTIRWGGPGYPLTPDTPGADYATLFGSAHPSGVKTVFCDGSIHNLSYSIDQTVLGFLCNRADGQAVNWSAL